MKKIFSTALMALAFAACQNNEAAEANESAATERGLTFTIQAPEVKNELVLTRGLSPNDLESYIDRVDIFAFSDGATADQVYSMGETALDNGDGTWTVSFRSDWLDYYSDKPVTFYFIANDNTNVQEIHSRFIGGDPTTEEDFVDKLITISQSNESLTHDDYPTMLMAAKVEGVDLSVKQSIDVNLKRTVARVDILNDDAENVVIDRIELTGGHSRSKPFMEAPEAGKAYLYDTALSYTSPLVSFAESVDHIPYNDPASYDNEEHLLERALYLHPMTIAHDGGQMVAKGSLVVWAYVNNNPIKFNVAAGTVVDILPNKRYIIKLNSKAHTFELAVADYDEGETITFD